MRLSAVLGAALVLFATTGSSAENSHVREILASIAGKEKLPAGEVFKNVKLLTNMSAERLLRVMEIGYSQSLGVSCEHCHAEGRWDADEKRQKRAAREMILLTNEINEKLKTMQDIDSSEAVVNCTTCHRGFVKPALQMK